MASVYETQWMPEYGRSYWEKNQINRRLTAEQLLEIAETHLCRENQMVLESNKFLFVDTTALTTYHFSLDYHGYSLPALRKIAEESILQYDYVFLCGEDIPYEDTWDRSGPGKRKNSQRRLIRDLASMKVPYVTLKGDLRSRIATIKRTLCQAPKVN